MNAAKNAPPATTLAESLSALNHARAEIADLEARLDLARRDYEQMEQLNSTLVAELQEVRAEQKKATDARIALEKQLRIANRQIAEYRTVCGAARLALWQLLESLKRLVGRGS